MMLFFFMALFYEVILQLLVGCLYVFPPSRPITVCLCLASASMLLWHIPICNFANLVGPEKITYEIMMMMIHPKVLEKSPNFVSAEYIV